MIPYSFSALNLSVRALSSSSCLLFIACQNSIVHDSIPVLSVVVLLVVSAADVLSACDTVPAVVSLLPPLLLHPVSAPNAIVAVSATASPFLSFISFSLLFVFGQKSAVQSIAFHRYLWYYLKQSLVNIICVKII